MVESRVAVNLEKVGWGDLSPADFTHDIMHQLAALSDELASEGYRNCRFNQFADPTGMQTD
jgi:hypothetical protein